MKVLSRLFRAPSAPTAPVAVEPPSPPPEPAAPAVDPAEQQQLLLAIEAGSLDSTELMRLAVEGQTTRVRQAAAAAIHDPDAWRVLLPRLRGRDKAAYKLLKQRLDEMLDGQRTLARIRSDAEALCVAIERIAAKPYDAMFASSLAAHAARWQALPAGVDAAILERGQLAIDRGHQVIAAHERELARVAAERAEEETRARALEAERLSQQQAADEQAVLAAREQAMADQARDAEARAEAQQLADRQAADAQVHAEIQSLIRLSGAALGRGDTRKAARFRQSIDSSLPGLPALPPHLARSLEQLDARLNQLRQWKDYVAAPKRIELIEEVEALIGADEPPESLLEHLRALREEWRTINKGLSVDATTETQRFEQAYKTAFQPCQAYLAEQAAICRANLEARRQLLERVLAFESGLDADSPDHPMMARVLREAPQAWRGHAPVDRDAGRALDTEFFGALDRLRTRVAAWYERNADDKQALIARAAHLAESADLPRAIDEVKRLQAQWKLTGPVPHAQSQSLWEDFRAQCDAVFARRQQELAQQQVTLEQAKSAAEALCLEIEQACQQGPVDRPGGEARLRAWQDAFHAMGELPRGDVRSLRERYQRAFSQFESQIAGLAQRDAQAIESNVLEAARHVRAFQRAAIHADAAKDELKIAAEAFIAGVPRWPGKRIPQALRQAIARVDSPDFTQGDDAAREQALRALVIRAEILSGAATPPEDAGLRRQQEMLLLQRGLGQARQADERAWEAMRIEWLGLGATEESVHSALEQRFMRCMRRRGR